MTIFFLPKSISKILLSFLFIILLNANGIQPGKIQFAHQTWQSFSKIFEIKNAVTVWSRTYFNNRPKQKTLPIYSPYLQHWKATIWLFTANTNTLLQPQKHSHFISLKPLLFKSAISFLQSKKGVSHIIYRSTSWSFWVTPLPETQPSEKTIWNVVKTKEATVCRAERTIIFQTTAVFRHSIQSIHPSIHPSPSWRIESIHPCTHQDRRISL